MKRIWCLLFVLAACAQNHSGDDIPPDCGDGIVQSDEQCDDGNMVSGDGCSAACVVESGNP